MIYQLLALIRKEIIQLLRNKSLRPIILLMPIVQLIVLGLAASFDVKDLKIVFVDREMNQSSRQMIEHFSVGQYFRYVPSDPMETDINQYVLKKKVDAVVNIPSGFFTNIATGKSDQLQLAVNAIDGSKSGLAAQYTSVIISDYINRELLNKRSVSIAEPQFRFNPRLRYPNYMVPGIMAILVGIITIFLSSLNIVREKETGTIDQLRVTPLNPVVFIVGKLVPLWLLGQFMITVGIIVATLIYKIPIVGNPMHLYLFAGLFMFTTIPFGLMLSVSSRNQQEAMFTAWFFLVVFVMISGFFTPIENMPSWAEAITQINPIRYFMEAVRSIFLKGSGLADLLPQLRRLVVMGVSIFSLSLWVYWRTTK